MTGLVVDSSTLVNAFISQLPRGLVDRELHAPALIDFEYVAVIRRKHQLGELTGPEATIALGSFLALEIERHPASRLISRMWSLRDNISAYDASYVALAEALNVPLMTDDRKLASAAAPYCEVITAE
jgi:predicted nucleic acid-binding protein